MNPAGRQKQVAICIKNESYLVSLEVGKAYRVIADLAATTSQQMRIVDESGEDYLYPEEYFVVREVRDGTKDT